MIDTQPPRGAFDYLLEPIRDQLQPPPPPPERREGGALQRIPTRRAAKEDIVGAIIGLIVFGVMAWGITLFALVAWGVFG